MLRRATAPGHRTAASCHRRRAWEKNGQQQRTVGRGRDPGLVQLFGVGPVLAAKLLGEVGDIGRFPTKHHFAAHTGTAPLEASSGQVVRHRLSRAGDRKLNHALYLMAIVQIRHPTAGQAYYQRKLAEGKSAKEALRCLKRRLSDAVYQRLVADHRAAGPATTTCHAVMGSDQQPAGSLRPRGGRPAADDAAPTAPHP
jgi:transposase